jgi:hypothetical protein
MNFSNAPDANSTNSTYYYYTLDDLLTSYGSTWALDNWSFLPFTITGIIGFILNTLAFVVFQDGEFDIPLYAFLRVYCLNNACLCFISIFNFTFSSIRLFSFANSYGAQFYYNYIYTSIATTNYFYGSTIDLFIQLDRIASFEARAKAFLKLPPYCICFLAFICCVIIDMPTLLQFGPASHTSMLNATTSYTVWFTANTDFATSQVGSILIFVVYGVRDVFVLTLQIGLNVCSTYLLKRYLNKKKAMNSALAADTTRVKNDTSMSARQSRTGPRRVEMSRANTNSSVARNSAILNRISRSDLRATIMVCLIYFSKLLKRC